MLSMLTGTNDIITQIMRNNLETIKLLTSNKNYKISTRKINIDININVINTIKLL